MQGLEVMKEGREECSKEEKDVKGPAKNVREKEGQGEIGAMKWQQV